MWQRRLVHLLLDRTKTQNLCSHGTNRNVLDQYRSLVRQYGTKRSNESVAHYRISRSKGTSERLQSTYYRFCHNIYRKSYNWSSSRHMSTTTALSSAKKFEAARVGASYLVTDGDGAPLKVAAWLFGCAAWVFSMVILGGMTRLTRSGLSMTEWKFTGSLPPMTEDEWQLEFEKYKQSPEYKRVNKGIGLEDFKFIYWMEYAHRMWGRGLGIVFAGPFSYFVWKGYITRQLGLRLSAIFAMGAGQGLIGWWMVKSGLQEPEAEYAEPRVSPYRLATHLTSAFVIYCGLLWMALSVAMPEPPTYSVAWVKGAAKVRRLALPVSAVVAITAISGAFVAGNDAGRAFNTFPKMGDKWIPDGLFELKPFMRNFFENTATVQHVVCHKTCPDASCSKAFGKLYSWNGILTGYIRNINPAILCPTFPWHCTSSRGSNAVYNDDTISTCNKEAVSRTIEISATCFKTCSFYDKFQIIYSGRLHVELPAHY
ncbi:cytochrome c oxidase assembly protein COX15 isoform X2 [Cryptomeria japonica]|uniref:cytochrome c oxidase assembly protein COX15 isoform X2 n=1 Tax=Cryptomeria japonica TaxID=3369 RepID=UPI0027D9F7EA|nr:cytochrome c oxidase assembly protein COX15 isoform X2 [Cryptomeria japonica]